MLNRRVLLTAAPLAWSSAALAARPSFAQVLASVRRDAIAQGMRAPIVDAALRGITPDPSVVKLDHNQPEFKLTWAQYRARVLPAGRLAKAHEAYAAQAPLLAQIGARYAIDPRLLIGFWGIESGFGAHTGGFNVIRSLATLVFDGRRAAFFREELLGALRILSDGDRAPTDLLGSWAGAMGQPQFLPSFYLRYAVDYDGDGKRDIWTSVPDIFASIANFMQLNHWRAAEPWGQQITLPPNFNAQTGRDHRQTLAAWMAQGVRRVDGTTFSRGDVQGAIIQPDGPAGDAFMVYPNFDVIRRYNPSDYYALGVGLLGYAAL